MAEHRQSQSQQSRVTVDQFLAVGRERLGMEIAADKGNEDIRPVFLVGQRHVDMLVKAAENGGGTDTASLVKGMTGMTFTGVGSTFTLDANGDPAKSVVINTFENGKVKWMMTLSPESTKA